MRPMTHPGAGTPAPASELVDVPTLLARYEDVPDPAIAEQRVAFGTSGHRGSALTRSFNDAHLAAIAQAIAEHRAASGVEGPFFLGADTHALSAPAQRTLLEVLVANGASVAWTGEGHPLPTPVVSHAILRHNRAHPEGPRADGVLVTPSHNPPEDGGVKYNPPHGGPADTDVTKGIEARANEILTRRGAGVRRVSFAQARAGARIVDLEDVPRREGRLRHLPKAGDEEADADRPERHPLAGHPDQVGRHARCRVLRHRRDGRREDHEEDDGNQVHCASLGRPRVEARPFPRIVPNQAGRNERNG